LFKIQGKIEKETVEGKRSIVLKALHIPRNCGNWKVYV